MNLDNLWDLVRTAFFVGMGAGLLLAYLMCALVWRWSMTFRVSELAARIAEKSALEAEIRVDQQRLERGRAALVEMFRKTDDAEAVADQAVSQ